MIRTDPHLVIPDVLHFERRYRQESPKILPRDTRLRIAIQICVQDEDEERDIWYTSDRRETLHGVRTCTTASASFWNTLNTSVEDLRDTVEQQAERITELETELAQTKDHTGREFADIRARITDIEERNQATQAPSEDTTPGVETDKTGPQNAETPLERICALPEHVADRELTANQKRARFIARDVRDYAEKAPAGLVIDSRAIKRVLTAAEGKRPHTQTVARVMNFLDDLGKEDVQLKKRRGTKLVVVDPEVATRYAAHHDRCDGEGSPTHADGVISSG